MAIRLFHRTTGDAVAPILEGGFRDGEDGGVWFSPRLDCCGEQGRHLIEVMVEMTAEDLASYSVEAAADEVWDDDAGDFVKVEDEAMVQRFTWYKIPAAVVNAHGRARHVSPDEAAAIELD